MTEIDENQNYFFKGKIDEFRLWNTELTPDQITQDVKSETPFLDELIVHYDFNGDVVDKTTGNDGKIEGNITFGSEFSVLWDDPTNAVTHSVKVTPLENKLYTVTLTNKSGCKAIGKVKVTVDHGPNTSDILYN